MTENHPHHPESDDDLAPEDDAVIGRAFRASLVAIVAGAFTIAVVILVLKRQPDAAPEVELETTTPVAVRHEITVPALPFRDITAEAGIDFVHTNGAAGEKLLPETMGSGAAFFDYDRDGDPDLLLANGTSWPHAGKPARSTSALYRNDGRGHFTDVTREAGLDVGLYGTGVAVGDCDNDGWLDVYLTAVGENRLLHNDRGRFRDVTAEAGVAGGPSEWSTSAAFFDADNDGDLDLFVGNYVRWSREIDREVDFRLTGVGRAYGPPFNYEGTFPYLFRNDGDGGGPLTFTDISEDSGIRIRNKATGVPVAKALGLAPVDLDRDGWMDVIVANDTVRNFLLHNRGLADGRITFEDTAELAGLAYDRNGQATGAMGIDAACYRNDADLGLVMGNFANEMTSLYISQGDPSLFTDEAIVEGVGAPSRTLLSFGVLLLDVDLDGRLDLLQTNGHLENEIATVDPSQTYEQPSQLFWNVGPDARATFVAVENDRIGDLAIPAVGRGSAAADIDGDGDLDVVITQVARRPLLLRNDQDLGHHWLRVRLADPAGQRDAIGAWIELAAGGMTQRRQVMPTRSYQSQSELPVTFGLGPADRVDSLTVHWPDGTLQTVDVPAVDRLLEIEKP